MSKRLSLAISLSLLAVFAITAFVVGRPTLPLFDELPPNTATGFIAYQNHRCVYVADLARATVNEAFCPSLDPEEGNRQGEVRFAFTQDGKLQVGTWDSDTAVVIDPASGLVEGELEWVESAESRELTERLYPRWEQEDHPEGLLITVEGREHLLRDVPSAYSIHNVTASPDGIWVAAQDNAGELVLLGPSGPWVVDTELDDYSSMDWAP